MRKVMLAIVGTAALATGSMAGAAVMVTGSTNLNSPNPMTGVNAVEVNGNTTTITFGQNPEPSGMFSGSFTFNNSLSGLYSILIGTSTPHLTFTSATLAGIMGTTGSYALSPLGSDGSAIALNLPETLIGPGTYQLTFGGTAPANGGVVNGNITITNAPVPEPATWALMILGFGAIGYSMRRRRRPALAQLA